MSTDIFVADRIRDYPPIQRSNADIWDAKETPSGAQTKATKALNDAKAYTDAEVDKAVKAGAVKAQGNWDSTRAYATLDLVFHTPTGDSWYAKEATVAGEEPNVSTKWNRYAEGLNKAGADAAYAAGEIAAPGINGVVGNGTTNDAAAIQALNNTAAANKTTLYIGPGDFNLGTTTLTITAGHVVMHPLARLLYTGTGVAVLINNVNQMRGFIRVERPTIGWDTGADTTSVGVRVKNTSGARLGFICRGFSIGVEMYGDADGTAYNVVDLVEVRENKRCLVFTSVDTAATGTVGWANANEFRGWLRISSGYASYTGTRLIDLSTTGNGNTFVGVTLEGVNPEKTIVVKMLDNVFLNCRWEGIPAGGVEFLAESYANYVIGGYGNFGPGSTIFADNGRNVIIGARGMRMRGDSAAGTSYNGGLAAYEATPLSSNNDRMYSAENLAGNRTWAVNALGVAETKHSAEAFPRVRSAAQGGPGGYGGLEFGRGNIEPDAKLGRSAGTAPALEANVPIKLAVYTTAGRPSAAVGAASLILDSTLGVPIYSDGTNWRKFSDNTVA